MKKFYSEYKYQPWIRTISRTGLLEKLDDFKIRDMSIKFLKETGKINQEQIWLFGCLALAECRIFRGLGTHYFIESGILTDLLIGSVKQFNASILDVFQEHKIHSFMIHPPSPQPCLLVSIETSNEGWTNCVIRASEGEVTFLGNSAFEKTTVLTSDRYDLRLAIGLALYARFHPECVRDGIPEDAKFPNHYRKSRCATLKLSEKFIDRSGPCPHYRKWHTRFLSSPQFKNKQGQVVEVASCWVKGKTKIVVEAEND